MSIGISGKIEIRKRTDIVQVSYDIQQYVNKARFGCKMGGNVDEKVFQMYGEKMKDCLYFELTESPIDNYADGIFCIENNKRYQSIDEIFALNLSRMGELWKKIINIHGVTGIKLNINYLFGEKTECEKIYVKDFTSYAYKKCQDQNFFEPVINVKMVK